MQRIFGFVFPTLILNAYVSAHNGHINVLNALLSHTGVNVNRPKNDGTTPLYIAAYKGNSTIVRRLLMHPEISMNQESINGAVPLFVATQEGHVKVVEAILSHPQVDVNKGEALWGQSPLITASWLGHGQGGHRN